MARDYDKEIKEAKENLLKIQQEKHSEFIKNLPDVRGRYFKAACKTFYKVIEVVDANEHDEIYCDVFYVRLNEDNTQACINSYSAYCEISLNSEISEEEFVKWYNKAIEIVTSL